MPCFLAHDAACRLKCPVPLEDFPDNLVLHILHLANVTSLPSGPVSLISSKFCHTVEVLDLLEDEAVDPLMTTVPDPSEATCVVAGSSGIGAGMLPPCSMRNLGRTSSCQILGNSDRPC